MQSMGVGWAPKSRKCNRSDHSLCGSAATARRGSAHACLPRARHQRRHLHLQPLLRRLRGRRWCGG
eukprot:3929774-Prymnesium_polylepis.1